MLKEMSASGESARSETLLIEAFERAIAKMDASNGTGAGKKSAEESQYSRFKKWEQLWKSDHSSMDVDGGAGRGASGNPLPMPPLPPSGASS